MDKEKKWRPVLPTIVPAYNRRVPDFIYSQTPLIYRLSDLPPPLIYP